MRSNVWEALATGSLALAVGSVLMSWAYPESSWAPQGLSWVSLGSLLGLSCCLETCPNYERGCFASQITAPKSLRVQGVGFVLQNTAPNASP